MAERLQYLEAVVGIDITQFRKGMRDIRNETGILSEVMSGIGGAARTATFAFTVPVVAGLSTAVDAASKFDGAMRNINSLLLLSDGQFSGLSDEVLAFASTTRDGVIPATEALYEVFSAGITDQERAMEIWKVSTKVAEAGLSDLSNTTNAVTATMSAFNLEQDQATRVGNVWSRMVQVGVGSLDDFLSNSQKVLPLSAALGISLEDMGASLAFLSQGGGGAAKAETAYAMMLSNLMKPTEAMKEAFGELGVTMGDELIEQFGSVGGAINALHDTVDENTFRAMFSKTGLEAANRMVTNFDQLTEATALFNKNLDTATMDAWAQQAKSFDFQLDLLKTALGGLATVIGQVLLPIITPVINGFTDLVTSAAQLDPKLVELGVVLVSVAAAAAPIVWILTSLLSPIPLIIAGIAGLATAFATNFGGIRDTVETFVSGLLGETGLGAIKQGVDDFMAVLFPKDTKAQLPKFVVDSPADLITINPGSESMSLWSFFEGEGFIDEFSWESFQQMARDAGWDGNAIDPGEILNLIKPTGSTSGFMDNWLRDMIGSKDDMVKAWGDFDRANMEEGGAGDSIFTRLADAAAVAWPSIETALTSMWANFQVWVDGTALPAIDTAGSDVISHIAGWFSSSDTGGDTPVYQAIKTLLSGDIGKAAGEMGSIFQKHFPQVTTALNTFITNFGDWLINEGIPTAARTIGMFGGKLVLLLNSAISGAFDFLTGSGEGTADGVGTVVQDSFFTPMNEGFQEALGDAGINSDTAKGTFDSFFTNLEAGLLAAALAWTIAPAFAKNIVTKITGAVAKEIGLTAAWKGLTSSLTTGLTAGLPAAVAGLGTIALGGLAIGATILAIHLAVNEDARTQAHEAITGLLDSLFGTGATQKVEDSFATGFSAWIAGFGDAVGNTALTDAALAQGQDVKNEFYRGLLESPAGVMGGMGVSGRLTDAEILSTVFGVTDAELTAAGYDVGVSAIQKMQDSVIAGVNSVNSQAPKGAAAIQGVFGDPFAPFAGAGGMNFELLASMGLDELGANVRDHVNNMDFTEAGTALDTKMSEAIPPEVFQLTGLNLQSAVDTVIQSGEFDGQVIVDKLITPIADGFTTQFGAASPATLAWTTFTDAVATKITEMGVKFTEHQLAIATLKLITETDMPLIQAAVVTAFDAISTVVAKVAGEITAFTAALAALDGTSVTVGVAATTTSAGVDGTHAGGLDYVPYDGYIAELHKGERVVPASVNRQSVIGRDTGGGATYNTNSFVVEGVTSFDDIVREARRRGYPIDRR